MMQSELGDVSSPDEIESLTTAAALDDLVSSSNGTGSTLPSATRQELGVFSAVRASKRACQTCRNRKVKCDGQSPCARCSKAGIECIYPPSRRESRRKDDAPSYPHYFLQQHQEHLQPHDRQPPPQQHQHHSSASSSVFSSSLVSLSAYPADYTLDEVDSLVPPILRSTYLELYRKERNTVLFDSSHYVAPFHTWTLSPSSPVFLRVMYYAQLATVARCLRNDNVYRMLHVRLQTLSATLMSDERPTLESTVALLTLATMEWGVDRTQQFRYANKAIEHAEYLYRALLHERRRSHTDSDTDASPHDDYYQHQQYQHQHQQQQHHQHQHQQPTFFDGNTRAPSVSPLSSPRPLSPLVGLSYSSYSSSSESASSPSASSFTSSSSPPFSSPSPVPSSPSTPVASNKAASDEATVLSLLLWGLSTGDCDDPDMTPRLERTREVIDALERVLEITTPEQLVPHLVGDLGAMHARLSYDTTLASDAVTAMSTVAPQQGLDFGSSTIQFSASRARPTTAAASGSDDGMAPTAAESPSSPSSPSPPPPPLPTYSVFAVPPLVARVSFLYHSVRIGIVAAMHSTPPIKCFDSPPMSSDLSSRMLALLDELDCIAEGLRNHWLALAIAFIKGGALMSSGLKNSFVSTATKITMMLDMHESQLSFAPAHVPVPLFFMSIGAYVVGLEQVTRRAHKHMTTLAAVMAEQHARATALKSLLQGELIPKLHQPCMQDFSKLAIVPHDLAMAHAKLLRLAQLSYSTPVPPFFAHASATAAAMSIEQESAQSLFATVTSATSSMTTTTTTTTVTGSVPPPSLLFTTPLSASGIERHILRSSFGSNAPTEQLDLAMDDTTTTSIASAFDTELIATWMNSITS